MALVIDGQIHIARGYGYADLEQRTTVDADQTLFRVGSIAKLVTWTAVMQLAEQGRLDLHTRRRSCSVGAWRNDVRLALNAWNLLGYHL